ncbi:substrate-binding domain-containing protein [Lactonifactor sp. BIOML-A3]|uniref:ABC transporter substrate-binding protein n=1 Tax=unclassified Lactonifactor TaxID=2636670 RepID=UPI0012B0B38C|nr:MULTISPECIES: ABC transporter substrate-binding protein [unclassified Lactonifactor]MSA04084.1 substrate-binding domain-containing protein [Lactonifactor sp. BIOML-A5]MSA10688.1 substrate-binding domain-containing protein [Lactonifactor sp. BIOML-A4]MSA15185.1 substrate-binding domain-containing protein [Lactonifactor sp. BIOML-A3]MSA19625.1 substrate-binding domain-containing protein [Lactonifactor sp. BIOML-A2]MSA40264.1 substrate-binding domain-containing protein [Lactonifactor sp. BIOML
MKKKVLSMLICMTMASTMLFGCGSGGGSDSASADTSKTEEAKDTESTQAADKEEDASADDAGASGVLKKGDYVIGLSNSYFGNTWRKQMVEAFTKAADEAKAAGYIKDYEVQNGDNTVNSQIAQINSFILSNVDAICICAASPTALNSTIQKALDAGIKVVAFDSIVDLEGVYTMDYPWQQIGKDSVEFVAEKLGGKGNVVVVRGVSGAAPDQGIYAGITEAIKNYPDLKIVQEVIGEASATKTQEELTKVLPSLPDVDAVITHCGGDAIGAVNAFEQSGRETPIIIGDNTAEFINWWMSKDGYETLSQGSTPGCGAAAFWTALDILNGYDVPEEMMIAVPHITVDNLSEYEGMSAGTFVSPDFTNEYVIENIIDAAK